MLEAMGALLLAWGGTLTPLSGIAVSGVYFFSSPRSQPLSRRLLASAHGLAIALLYMAALIVMWTHREDRALLIPFYSLLSIPVILMALSFVLYQGRKAVHVQAHRKTGAFANGGRSQTHLSF
jgi:hypothetical protein